MKKWNVELRDDVVKAICATLGTEFSDLTEEKLRELVEKLIINSWWYAVLKDNKSFKAKVNEEYC